MNPLLARLAAEVREARRPRSLWPPEPPLPDHVVIDAARRGRTRITGCERTGRKGGQVPNETPDFFERNPHDVIANAAMGSLTTPSAMRGRKDG